MQLPAPFAALGDHIGIAAPGGRALFTTRRGGVSEGAYASLNLGRWTDDDPDAVHRNRELVADIVGVPLDAVVQGRQVHGARVERVTGPRDARSDPPGEACAARAEPGDARSDPHDARSEPPEVDGLATATAGLAILVLTADCLPVALIGAQSVAMLHAGWRGLAEGVLEAGVTALRELGDDGPLQAAIGPGAGGCCYEVGPEVHAAFGREAPRATIDLKAIARERLAAAGVAHVHDVGICTMCVEPGLFFSHRRDGGVTGRQAGIAWRG